jgi:DNA-binding transcriptional regulator YiaG
MKASSNAVGRDKAPSKARPTKAQVIEARKRSGLTVPEAAVVVYVSRRAWHLYESGTSRMSAAAFELFKIKTGQF